MEETKDSHFPLIEKEFYSNGSLKMSGYRYGMNGQRHGEYTYWYETARFGETPGVWKIDNYKNGKLHGECKEYYPNGQLWEKMTYDNGKAHGECKNWHENGELALEGSYANDERNGEWKLWFENGCLWREIIYENGEIRSSKEWKEDGSAKISPTLFYP